MKKIVLGLSGGMDSATLLGYFLEQGAEVHCCSFMYGSKHQVYEMQAANDIIMFYAEKNKSVKHIIYDLRQPFMMFDSALLKTGEAIPEGHYNGENMKRTVVPGRNLILASLMAGYAESIGADVVALGVHSGDHHIYPDCRPEFLYALEKTIRQSSEGKVGIMAPFINEDKASILRIGYGLKIPVPYHLTRTCYKDQYLSCGKCGSCRERFEAFELIGVKDPIEYEV